MDFKEADLTGAILRGAVISADKFEGADLTDTDWEGAIVGTEDSKRICANPTLKDMSRFYVGCRD